MRTTNRPTVVAAGHSSTASRVDVTAPARRRSNHPPPTYPQRRPVVADVSGLEPPPRQGLGVSGRGSMGVWLSKLASMTSAASKRVSSLLATGDRRQRYPLCDCGATSSSCRGGSVRVNGESVRAGPDHGGGRLPVGDACSKLCRAVSSPPTIVLRRPGGPPRQSPQPSRVSTGRETRHTCLPPIMLNAFRMSEERLTVLFDSWV